jgi:LysR family transcriptional regulator for bpeEF and oprC
MDRLWAMEVFVRIADCGSFSRAAASLGLANATMTLAVHNLERHLGVTLINRNTRGLNLSEEGTLFLQSCREVLGAVERAETEVKSQLGAMRGLIRVEMPIGIGHALICPALDIFARRYPQTSVSVNLTNQPSNLIESAIDVAIRVDRVDDMLLVARPIYEARYVICGTPEIIRQLPQEPGELDAKQCIGIISEDLYKPNPWIVRRGDREVIIEPAGPLHLSSSQAVVSTGLGGLGLICVLDLFANPFLSNGKLVEIYSDWTTKTRTFYAVTAKTRCTTAKVRAFIDFLLETLEGQRRPNTMLQIPVATGSRARRGVKPATKPKAV